MKTSTFCTWSPILWPTIDGDIVVPAGTRAEEIAPGRYRLRWGQQEIEADLSPWDVREVGESG